MDGEDVGVRENDVEWVYGTTESASVPIKTFTTYYKRIPVNAKMLTNDKVEGAYVNFIPQEEWDHPFVKAKLRQLIGKIRWVSDQSRLDVSYEELELSMAASAPTIGD